MIFAQLKRSCEVISVDDKCSGEFLCQACGLLEGGDFFKLLDGFAVGASMSLFKGTYSAEHPESCRTNGSHSKKGWGRAERMKGRKEEKERTKEGRKERAQNQ